MHGRDIHSYNQEHGIWALHRGIGACVAWRMNKHYKESLRRLNEEFNLDALGQILKSINDMQRKISGLKAEWGATHN